MYERSFGSQTTHNIRSDCNPLEAQMCAESTSRIEEEFTVISMVDQPVSVTTRESLRGKIELLFGPC